MAQSSTRTQLTLHNSVLDPLKPYIPERKSLTQFVEDLLEKQQFELDSGNTLGKPSSSLSSLREREVLPSLNKEIEAKNSKLLSESINHPPTQSKRIDPALLEFEALIREFWKIKGGTKSETSWKLLMTGLKAIKDLDGDGAVETQLEEAINGKWKGITLRNYMQFRDKGKPRPWEQEPESKHPAFRDAREIIAERGSEWDIPSVTGGRGVLEPGAF